MITKWSKDVPFALSHGKTIYWQPESLPNFETTAQAHYLGMRLAWDKTRKPQDIIEAFNTHYYGQAAPTMAEYWQFIDSVWVDTPEYSGSGWGHLVRWTPERLKKARELMEKGKRAATTQVVNDRITLADESLKLFEQFMQMRQDFAQGRWKRLPGAADAYLVQSALLAQRYKNQYAFTTGLHMGGAHNTLNMHYFRMFYLNSYLSAASISREHRLLLKKPIRQWKYQIDRDDTGLKQNWQKPAFNDDAWKTTDAAIETWSTLGYDNYMGSFWYRNTLTLDDLPSQDRIYLWIGAFDGQVSVYVNGQLCDALLPGGKLAPSITDYANPASFDITDALKAGENQISIHTRHVELNELHTGGLMGPATIYATPVSASKGAARQ